MKDMKERVDEIIYKSFSICGCPINLIKEFKTFCFTETKGDYSMGLKVLLERNSIGFQQKYFVDKLNQIENKIQVLEYSLNEEKDKEKKPKIKTLGSGGKNDE